MITWKDDGGIGTVNEWYVYDMETGARFCQSDTKSKAILKFQTRHPGEKLAGYIDGKAAVSPI